MAALWAPAAKEFRNCGATEEVLDGLGRRWKRDEPYLTVADSDLESFDGDVVDDSLLTDRDIPEGAGARS